MHPLSSSSTQANCIIDSPVTSTFMGTSPPVRTGATNPLVHDAKWGSSATLDGDTSDCCPNTPEWLDTEVHDPLTCSPGRLWPLPFSASPRPTFL